MSDFTDHRCESEADWGWNRGAVCKGDGEILRLVVGAEYSATVDHCPFCGFSYAAGGPENE